MWILIIFLGPIGSIVDQHLNNPLFWNFNNLTIDQAILFSKCCNWTHSVVRLRDGARRTVRDSLVCDTRVRMYIYIYIYKIVLCRSTRAHVATFLEGNKRSVNLTLAWHIIRMCKRDYRGTHSIVTYSGFAWLIRRAFQFFDRIYWTFIQLVTTVHKWLTRCHLPTGHSTRTILTSTWTPLYSIVLLCTPLVLLTVPSYNFSARTPRKTPSSVKNACLLVRFLAVDDIVDSACFGNVFTEPLPSNGHKRHRLSLMNLQRPLYHYASTALNICPLSEVYFLCEIRGFSSGEYE
jgi:hypothetical protein